MARARNIKPSLFSNELLGTADPLLTMLFISLWTLADRKGLLEDRPLRIKAQTFPYRDSLDINGYLTELERLGFILRYEVSGMALIQVLNFSKHQSPHKTEKESTLPMPCENSPKKSDSCDLTVKKPLSNDGITAALPPDSLIPDSLIPDSLIPDSLKKPAASIGRKRQSTKRPDDWVFSEKHKELAASAGLNVSDQCQKFMDWHDSKGSVFADWDAAFRTWLRKSKDMMPPAGRHAGFDRRDYSEGVRDDGKF